MSKYAVGDKVLVYGEIIETNYSHRFPYKVKFVNDADVILSENELSKISKTYEDGLNDAWELARKIGFCSKDKLLEIFGDYEIAYAFEINTYQQALAKIEAYEESKAIKVGDVVECFGDYKAVVLDCDDEQELLDVFNENGCVDGLDFSDVKKIGRHIDISNLLEQIRGDE